MVIKVAQMFCNFTLTLDRDHYFSLSPEVVFILRLSNDTIFRGPKQYYYAHGRLPLFPLLLLWLDAVCKD